MRRGIASGGTHCDTVFLSLARHLCGHQHQGHAEHLASGTRTGRAASDPYLDQRGLWHRAVDARQGRPLRGEIRARFGAAFLRRNRNFLETRDM